MSLTKSELAKYMDHTLLKADATAEQIDRVAAEARELNTASVCVNGYWVPRVAAALEGTDVMTCAVIGFPLGAMSTAAKAAETADVVAAGAREVDMVINIGELKAGNDDVVRADIAAVAEAAHAGGAHLKVIIECCLLTEEEKIRASRLTVEGGADFVKTSTGFSTGGATFHDVELFAKHVKPGVKIKAAGGISSLEDAEKFIELGASRLGTSRVVKIVKKLEAEKQ